MRHFIAAYTLRNGTRGTLPVIARTSCDAILLALDTFGHELRRCSVRPA